MQTAESQLGSRMRKSNSPVFRRQDYGAGHLAACRPGPRGLVSQQAWQPKKQFGKISMNLGASASNAGASGYFFNSGKDFGQEGAAEPDICAWMLAYVFDHEDLQGD